LKYLLDTCVISEMVKPNPETKVIRWILAQDESYLFLSVITLGEIQKGISKLPESKRKKALQAWLQADLQERFNGRIIPVDHRAALNWGIIQAAAEKNGNTIPAIDGIIAAQAITHSMTVVTRNINDMQASGALLFNPWGSVISG
jgi:predicted nucleic acid-binding protein